jgi:hypothetical protein
MDKITYKDIVELVKNERERICTEYDNRAFFICRYSFAHESRAPLYLKNDPPCFYPNCYECPHAIPHILNIDFTKSYSICTGLRPACVPLSHYNFIYWKAF